MTNGDIVIEYCLTEDMMVDYFTKSLQGRLFYKLSANIMNIGPNDPYYLGHRSVLEKADNCNEDDVYKNHCDENDMQDDVREDVQHNHKVCVNVVSKSVSGLSDSENLSAGQDALSMT